MTGMFVGVNFQLQGLLPSVHMQSQGITTETLTSGAMTKTLKDKGFQGLGFNVLLAHSTNFQHTSLLKPSLKLKLHQLTAYNRCIAAACRWKCSSSKQPLLLWTSLCATAMEQHSDPKPLSHSYTYLKITVIIRFPIVIPVPAQSLLHCTHQSQHR